MPDSKYPGQLDTDIEFPRIDDNITEIGGESINGIRSAIFAIQSALGLNIQGAAVDLATRISSSINPNGSLKASALAAAGLVSLPITNSQIATNAGIEESKLDLDHSTVSLATDIAELDTFTIEINNRLTTDIANMAQHIASPALFGRHETQDIDGYSGTQYDGYNLQGIITDLDNRLNNHINDADGAHNASAIAVDDTSLTVVASDAQTAIEELDKFSLTQTINHRDRNHGNGIIKSQETVIEGFNHSATLVASSTISSVSAGSNTIVFSPAPVGLATVARNDRAEVTIGSKTYVRYVESVNTAANSVDLFGNIPVTGAGTAAIFRDAEEVIAPSVLKIAIRQPDISATGGSIVQMVHPNAPFILSNGLDVRALSATASDIKIRWATGETDDIDAYDAMQTYPVASAPSSTWTVENLAIALNESFRTHSPDRHYPLVAFVYRGELGIAFDEPDGYIEIVAPTSNTAWNTLGFTETDKEFAIKSRRFYIDGYEYDSVRTVLDSTGATSGTNNVNTVADDMVALGLTASGLVRVKNSSDDGTYVFDAITSSILTISEHSVFTTDASVNVKIYADYFSVPAVPSKRTLYELFVDAYENTSVELRGAARVEYENRSGTPDDPERFFDIVAISRSFVAGEKRINFSDSGGDKIVTLGDRGAGFTVTNGGTSVALPTTNEEGFRFRLYDGNGVDFIDLEVANGAYTFVTNTNAIDLDISDRISEERHLQLATILHDKTSFKHLDDRRLFGTVGRKNVREDYTRDFVSYPTSLLRGNGIIYGFDVSDVAGDVQVTGGQSLVNGSISAIKKTTFTVPVEGATATYNVFIDEDGVLRFLKDDQFISGAASTPSLSEIILSSDKAIIAQVNVNSSDAITSVVDLRRFVGDLDDKIDLFIEENEITHGSFASLAAASAYANAISSSPSSRVMRVKGTVNVTSSVTLPSNVILDGDTFGSVTASGETKSGGRLSVGASGSVIIGSNSIIRNLNFHSSVTNTTGLISSSGTVINTLIENCAFEFTSINDSNIAINVTTGLDKCIIRNCTFDNVGKGMDLSGATLTDSMVDGNMFNEVNLSAIEVGSSKSIRSIISKNIIKSTVFSSVSTPYYIDLTDPEFTNIVNNTIQTTTTISEKGAMIRITNTSLGNSINGNKLINTNSTNQGFLRGIYLDGAAGTTGDDHTDDTIANNDLFYFFGTGPEIAIDIKNGNRTSVVGNKTLSGARSFNSLDCQFLNVSDNIFNSEATMTTTAVKLDAATPFSAGAFTKFIGNHVTNLTTTPLDELFEMTNVGGGCIISNNTFQQIRTGAITSAFAMVKVDTQFANVINNIIIGDTFTAGAPLNVTGASGYVAQNNLLAIVSAPSNNVVTTDDATFEHLNLGQVYTSSVSVTRSIIGSAWTYLLSPSGGSMSSIATGTNALINFTINDLGITTSTTALQLVNVGVVCQSSVTPSALECKLHKTSISTSLTNTELTATAVSPAGQGVEEITLTPDSTTYVEPNFLYTVVCDSTTTDIKSVYGININWKLI